MFKNSFLKAKAYKYSSLQYLDVEELELQAPEDILIDEPGVFILCKSVDEGHNIHWAAESTELFRTALIDLTSKFIQLPVGGTHRMYINLYIQISCQLWCLWGSR